MYTSECRSAIPAFRKLTTLSLGALMLGSAMTSGVAVAQEDEGALEEIVVTATFRETRLQDTAIAITAVTGDMLDMRSQTNIYQVANQAPNVTLKPGGVEKGPMIIAFIRGVGQTDFNYATEPGVGIYVDDVIYSSVTGSLIELLDLDRVEIARGPQGTLAGRNSIGGAIKLFSKKPGQDTGGNVQATFGQLNRVDVRGAADFTLAEDKLYGRVSGASRTRDGYVTRLDYKCMHPSSPIPSYFTGLSSNSGCVLGTEGGISYTAARAALRWIASDNFEANFSVDMTNDASEAAPGVLFQVNEQINNPNICCDASILQGHPNGYSVGGVGTEEGTFFDIDGDLTTTGDRVYYSNIFVPYGPFRGDSVVNDPYVNYSTYTDPNAPLPTRPFSPVAVPPINYLDHWGASLTLDWQFNDNFSLKSITAYRDYDADFAQDADQTPLHSQHLLQHVAHDQFTQELRLNGSFSNVDFTLGGFYLDQKGVHEANVNLYYIQLNFIHGPDPTPSDSLAAFGHLAWQLTDNLNLSLGVRYTEDTKDYTYFRRNIDGTQVQPCVLPPPGVPIPGYPGGAGFWDLGNPSNCGLFDPVEGVPLYDISATFESTRTDYRVALDYSLTDNVMAYGSFSSGYKGGGINPRPFFIIQIETFQPETMDTYEVGFKSELFDRRMRLNAAYFFNEYDDIQITQVACELPFPPFFGAPCLQPANAGSADVDGFELEMEWHPTDNFLIDAMVSSLNFEYNSVDPATAVSLDMITPYTPELQWSVGAQYGWEIGAAGTLTARIDAYYQDEIYTEPINDQRNIIEDYTVLNGRLTWRSDDGTWESSLEVTNLTNEVYYLSKFFDQWQSAGTISGSPAPPRLWAVTLRRNFE
jgi:iron complex outermembrane receptor protein